MKFLDALFSFTSKYIILSVPCSLFISYLICYTRSYAYDYDYIRLMTYQDYINNSLYFYPRVLLFSLPIILLPLNGKLTKSLLPFSKMTYYPNEYNHPDHTTKAEIRAFSLLWLLLPLYMLIIGFSDIIFRDFSQHHDQIYFWAVISVGIIPIATIVQQRFLFSSFYDYIYNILKFVYFPILFLLIIFYVAMRSYSDAIQLIASDDIAYQVTNSQSISFVPLEFLERGIVMYDTKNSIVVFETWDQIQSINHKNEIHYTSKDVYYDSIFPWARRR